MSPPLQSIGRFKLERELGRGANGVVYLATVEGLERQCALKVLPGARRLGDETVKRFELEANVASKLQAPGIARVWDLGWHGEHLYYVMDYCEGPTLRERLRERGALPPEEARALVLALARALSVAHQREILHRDLKPGNVILTASGPTITDFGMARDRDLARSLTQTGQLLGTPMYMAPEQIQARKDVDSRADVYALGVILYECLTGQTPFAGASIHELFQAVLDAQPAAPRSLVSTIPPRLEAVCLRAMASDREERYSDAAALATALSALGGGLDSLSLEEAIGPLPDDPAPRRWILPLVAVALLSLVPVLWLALRARRLNLSHAAATRAEALLRSDAPGAEVNAALNESAALAAGDAQLTATIEQARAALASRDQLTPWRNLFSEGAPPEAFSERLSAAQEQLGTHEAPPWLTELRRDAQTAQALTQLRDAADAMDLATMREIVERAQARTDSLLRAESRAARKLLAAREGLSEARLASREVAPYARVIELLAQAKADAAGAPALRDAIELEHASYLFRRGRFEEASRLGDALAARPGRVGLQGRYVAAFGRLWGGDQRRGLDELGGLWRDDLNGPVGLNAGAVYHSYGGKNPTGEKLARESIAIDPEIADPYISLAFCLNDQLRHREALEPLERAEALQPDHPRLYMARAYVTGGLERPAEMLANFDRVIELTQPKPPRRALQDRTRLLGHLTRYDEAKRDANALLKADPSDLVGLFWRGFASHQAGDVARAREDWQRARAVHGRSWVGYVRAQGGAIHQIVRTALFTTRR